MEKYLLKSAKLACQPSSEGWRPDKDLNQLCSCLRDFNYSINFTNMFGELEASISVFIVAEGRTLEVKGTGKDQAAAGFTALCDLIDLLDDK